MANKVTTTDTTNKVVITPQSSKKLTIDSGDGNNLTLNQSTPNNVQITNNDVDTSLTPNNVSISPTDNNVSLSSISTPVTVNQSSTSIVTVNTVGPQGPKGDNGADGDTLVSNDLENLRSFTGSIQIEVNNLTAATSSYLTSVPDGTISSSAQIIINESQISDLSHTDISALNTFTSSIQIKVDNLIWFKNLYEQGGIEASIPFEDAVIISVETLKENRKEMELEIAWIPPECIEHIHIKVSRNDGVLILNF